MPKGLIYCDACGKRLLKRMKMFQCEDCDLIVCYICAKEENFECGVCEPHIPELLEVHEGDK